MLSVQPCLQLPAPLRQEPGEFTEFEFGELKDFAAIEFVEIKECQRGPLRIGGVGNPNCQLRGLKLFNL